MNNNNLGVIVVTRFSVRWQGVLPSKEWIDYRFELLRQISWPSLQQQTMQDFVWLLVTAPEWYNYVSTLCKPLTLPSGTIKVVTGALDTGVNPEDLHGIYPGVQRFLTFRFDSDDAFASKTLETVFKAAAQAGDNVLFNLPGGVQLDWATNELFYRTFRSHYQGPFLALVNASRKNMSFTGGLHEKARKSLKVIEIPGIQWAQVIHSANLVNKMMDKSKLDKLRRVVRQGLEIVTGSKYVFDDVSPVPSHLKQAILADFGLHRQ